MTRGTGASGWGMSSMVASSSMSEVSLRAVEFDASLLDELRDDVLDELIDVFDRSIDSAGRCLLILVPKGINAVLIPCFEAT